MKKIIKMTIAIVLVVCMAFVTFGAQEYNLSNEIEKVQLVTQNDDVDIDKMDTVLFGSYPQNDETGKTKEPIEWIVLERDEINRKALLLSKYILDAKCYDDRYYDLRYLNTNLAKSEYSNDEYKEVSGYTKKSNFTEPLMYLAIALTNNDETTINRYIEHEFLTKGDIDNIKVLLTDFSFSWRNCSLQKWLNSEFINLAFNSDEKNKILETSYKDWEAEGNEKVLLLNKEQIDNYFPRQTDFLSNLSTYDMGYKRLAKATNYAKNQKNFDEKLMVFSKDSLVNNVLYNGYDYLMNKLGGNQNSNNGIGCSDYWLETYRGHCTADVIQSYDGHIKTMDFAHTAGVRPAIWISY